MNEAGSCDANCEKHLMVQLIREMIVNLLDAKWACVVMQISVPISISSAFLKLLHAGLNARQMRATVTQLVLCLQQIVFLVNILHDVIYVNIRTGYG